DPSGRLVFSYGNVDGSMYLRSTAKPIQVLPFVEMGGVEHFGLTERELAILCASHSGTDEHAETVAGIQRKIGVTEKDLMCGVHPPYHEPTAARMKANHEPLSENRHNCSGKHTGMLAQAMLRGVSTDNYIDPNHPVQQLIIKTFSEMTGSPVDEIKLGVDGCSAPVFAVPLWRSAYAMARLADPSGLPEARANACRKIFHAMAANPDMVAGPDRFDTLVMQVAGGKLIAKAGAEGFQGIAVLPGALWSGSPALGIAYKISDGDHGQRARPTVGTEILRQLGVLDDIELKQMAAYDARPQYNWRKVEVGRIEPAFLLQQC
ncbi:MAG: asparaginase, partial [Anaerolineaceae bacterium]|nr:asparaginase [Anaerolineaceae bacterium]